MRVVITGAAGMLGTHLVRALSEHKDNEILAVTSKTEHETQALWDLSGDEAQRVTRISNTELLRGDEVLRAGDVVINCAFPRNADGPEMADGLRFHQLLFQVCAAANLRLLVNVSSQSVYNQYRDMPACELSALSLDTPYAVGKYATELMMEALGPGLPHVNVRLASLISPSFDQRVINKLVARAAAGGELVITNGDSVFDFMDIRDAARALHTVITCNIDENVPALNVGAGQPFTLAEIASTVADTLRESRSICVDVRVEASRERATSSALDVSLLKRLYDFKPRYRLEDTILDIFDAQRAKLNAH